MDGLPKITSGVDDVYYDPYAISADPYPVCRRLRYDGAKASPTSTIRDWEALPVSTRAGA